MLYKYLDGKDSYAQRCTHGQKDPLQVEAGGVVQPEVKCQLAALCELLAGEVH